MNEKFGVQKSELTAQSHVAGKRGRAGTQAYVCLDAELMLFPLHYSASPLLWRHGASPAHVQSPWVPRQRCIPTDTPQTLKQAMNQSDREERLGAEDKPGYLEWGNFTLSQPPHLAPFDI